MNNYKIACMVKSSGKHLETEIKGRTMADAFNLFVNWLGEQKQEGKRLWIKDLAELDISEVVNVTDA